MATTLYPVFNITQSTDDQYGHNCQQFTNLAGSSIGWYGSPMRTTRGPSLQAVSTATVAGTTSGIECLNPSTEVNMFVSLPVSASVTISSTPTMNFWMAESNMNANVGAQVALYKLAKDGTLTRFFNSEKGAEVAITTRAAQNWATGTVTSTAFGIGDRIAMTIAANDGGGTMASGYTWSVGVAAASAGVDGDSYITFVENISFLSSSDASGSKLFLSSTSSDVTEASTTCLEAWTSQGSSVQTSVTNTAAGWTTGLLATASAGGNYIEWFTKQLQAFTLEGAIYCNIRSLASTVGGWVKVRVQIDVVASDGTGATLVSTLGPMTNISTGELARGLLLGTPSVSVTNGQRIRIRLYVDDGSLVLVTGRTATVYYAGAAGATGDSWIQLAQTVSEYTAGATEDVYPYMHGGYYP